MERTDYQRRDTEFLRCVAIIMIVNSHLDVFYPIPALGTGGAIGNSLFFMLSSFGLFLSNQNNPLPFKQYLRGRVRKIYPSVWIALVSLFLPSKLFIDNSLIDLNGILYFLSYFIYPYHNWFLGGLMAYYILGYYIMMHYNDRVLYCFIAILIAFYAYLYIYHTDLTKWSVESSHVRYLSYFSIFLSGVFIANRNENIKYNGTIDFAVLFFFLALMYGHKYLMHKNFTISLQFIQQLLLFPIVFYCLKISRSHFIQNLMANKTIATIVHFISTKTLQIFIVHGYLITCILIFKVHFPYNVLTVVILTLILASLMHIIAERFISPYIRSN